MKKIFAVLFAVVILISFVSCKNNVGPDNIRGEQTSVISSSTVSEAQSSADESSTTSEVSSTFL